MQLIILSAFAVVLWLNPTYQPFLRLSSGSSTLLLALVHPIITLVAAMLVSRVAIGHLSGTPPNPEKGQRILARGGALLAGLVIGGFLALVLGTDWVPLIRKPWLPGWAYGVNYLCILAPFLISVLALWAGLYRADRAIRLLGMEARIGEALPTHPVWNLGAYLVFNLRHHLVIILVPMVPVFVAFDATRAHERWLVRTTRIPWAADAALAVVAGAVFLILPVLLVWIWSTVRLEDGRLRSRLQALCDRIGLRYRQILMWKSQGQVINAAVTGLVAPVRYIMLSDGLLETMDDDKIEAVFGHEAGHVKHHHIFFFLLFAVLSMHIAGGVALAAAWFVQGQDRPVRELLNDQAQQTLILVSLGVLWGVGFGWISRRFERQADLYGVRSVTPAVTNCTPACRVHGAGNVEDVAGKAVCVTAVRRFTEALAHIAELNGIAAEARSWRHSSIGSRIRQLELFAQDPVAVARFDRRLRAIKIVLFVATAVAGAIALWIYWPF